MLFRKCNDHHQRVAGVVGDISSFKSASRKFFSVKSNDQWRVDGVVGDGVSDLQHRLPGRPRLLLLRPAHHQEEPRYQAGQNIDIHHANLLG